MLRHKITNVVDNLPFLPEHIDRLLQSAIKPTKDNIEILHKVSRDAGVWTSLLDMAKAYYGECDNVKTVEEAIHCIGFEPLLHLIGVAYARKAIEEEFASLKYLNEYFDHSEDISICCSIISRSLNISQTDRQTYTAAGLIHDIGRLALMVATNRTSAHVLGTLWDKMASVVYEEKANLSMDHCEVGKLICQKWNFSPAIQEAVARHHSPVIDGDFSFGGAIIFISHFLSASDPSGDIVSTLSSAAEVLENLKMTSDDFIKARETYKSRIQQDLERKPN